MRENINTVADTRRGAGRHARPVRIDATRSLLDGLEEGGLEQAANVASLSGIVGTSYCMPDGH